MLASRGLPLVRKGKLYSACAYSVMLSGNETWPVKEEDVIRLKRSDARMVIWISNGRPDDRISAEELRTRLKLKNMREYLWDRKLQWFGHLESMEESAWSSKCRTFKSSGSFLSGQPGKTWNEVIRSDLKKGKLART